MEISSSNPAAAPAPAQGGPSKASEVANLFSQILAANEKQKTCNIHEKCDGSCVEGGRSFFQPLVIGPQTSQLSWDPLPFNIDDLKIEDGTTRSRMRTEPLKIDESLSKFKYEPLTGTRTIRLLKIKQGIFRADPIDCDLIHVSLDDAPPYGSLSYCWGTDIRYEKMLCNGMVFEPRASLIEALKRYRAALSHDTTNIHEYIWADALCINQTDDVEKSHQLMLMRDIYAHAQKVYVDLGNVQPGWFTGLSLMKRAAFISELTNPSKGESTMEIDENALPGWNDPRWRAYWFLFTSPWFTRTWVVQEICLARDAKFLFGRFVFDRSDLEVSFEMLRSQASVNIAGDQILARGVLNFIKLLNIRKTFLGGHVNSFHLLRLTRDYNCTEPKDKVFALNALMSRRDQVAIGDYTASVETVYTRFAALQFMHGLEILDHAGIQRRGLRDVSLPSWVPDWTDQSVTNGPKIISSLRNVPYNASGTLIPRIGYFSPGNIPLRIGVGGFLFDKLKHVYEIIRTPDTEPKAFLLSNDALQTNLTQHQDLLNSVYNKPELALARTLLMDDDYTGGNSIERSEPIIDPVGTYHQVIDDIKNEQEGDDSWYMNIGPIQTFRVQMFTATACRRFAITEKGYMGLVSPAAKDGDYVGIFFGADVPYIIRPTSEDHFLLIGDAYVHGIMYGEALTQDYEAREIILE